jgi:hypothetical protein
MLSPSVRQSLKGMEMRYPSLCRSHILDDMTDRLLHCTSVSFISQRVEMKFAGLLGPEGVTEMQG